MSTIRFVLGVLFAALLTAPAGAQTLDDLFRAVKANDVSEVRKFLDRGMDVNSTSPQGYSVLMEAAREGHVEVLGLLLERKAKVNQRNPVNETALMLAAFKGHLEAVKLLHARGGEINNTGWSALHYAAFQGQTATCKYLLQSKAEIDARAPNGITPLMGAVRGGHYDTVKLLLWEVADPNLKNEAGGTALQWAVKGGNSDMVQLLKQAGAKE